MSDDERSKIEVAPEEWLGMGLSPIALDLLGARMTSVQFAEVLMAKSHFEDAIRVFANVLPVRTAVGWVLACIRQARADSVGSSAEAVPPIVKWLETPTDDHRRAAFAVAEAVGINKPVGCLGMAVYLSGGSMGPTSAPEVLPPAGVAARGLVGALMMAAVLNEPQAAPTKVRLFAEAGARLLSETKAKLGETKVRNKL
jgi:hypothetical protein